MPGLGISASGISGAPHPQPGQHQSAAVNDREIELQPSFDPKVAGKRQSRDAHPEHDKDAPQPQAGQGIPEHEEDRPKGVVLASAEMTQAAADQAEPEEKKNGDDDAPLKCHPGAPVL